MKVIAEFLPDINMISMFVRIKVHRNGGLASFRKKELIQRTIYVLTFFVTNKKRDYDFVRLGYI